MRPARTPHRCGALLTPPPPPGGHWQAPVLCTPSCTLLLSTPFQILIVAHAAWFAEWAGSQTGKRGAPAYDALKARFAAAAIRRLRVLFPRVTPESIVLTDVSTPLTIEGYLRSPSGGAVGLDHSPARFTDPKVLRLLDPESPVRGLWLTGQDTLLCGQPLAQVAGIVTALRLLGPVRAGAFIAQSIIYPS
jgi:hypothetical protein